MVRSFCECQEMDRGAVVAILHDWHTWPAHVGYYIKSTELVFESDSRAFLRLLAVFANTPILKVASYLLLLFQSYNAEP